MQGVPGTRHLEYNEEYQTIFEWRVLSRVVNVINSISTYIYIFLSLETSRSARTESFFEQLENKSKSSWVEMIIKFRGNKKGVATTCQKEGVRHLYISMFSFKLTLTRPRRVPSLVLSSYAEVQVASSR